MTRNEMAFGALRRYVLIGTLLTALCAGTALGQEFGGPQPEWTGKDYYMKATDPTILNLLGNVERNHMFRKNKQAEGVMQYDIGDLKYTLWVFPNHPRALYILGEIAKTTDNPALALPHFERAILLFPGYAYTRAQYGEFLVSIGAANAGIRELEAALRIDPNLAVAKAWLAEASKGNPRSTSGAVELTP